jgi:PAS domain S-box-containing protein
VGTAVENRTHHTALLAALIESTHDLIWSVDLEFRLVTFNRAFAGHVLQHSGVIAQFGMTPFDLLPPAQAAVWPTLFSRVLSDGPFQIEHTLGDGRSLELAFNHVLVEGDVTGISVFAKDITQHKRREAALERSEARFRSYFDLPLVGMASADSNRHLLSVNDRFCEILGYSREELLGATWDQLIYPGDHDPGRNDFERLLAGQIDAYSFDKRFLRKDGRIIATSVSVSCARHPNGGVDSICATIQDISERKAAEQALLRAEQEYRDFFEQAPEGIFKSIKGKSLSSINPAGARMLGYHSPGEALAAFSTSPQACWFSLEDRVAFVDKLEVMGEVRGEERRFRCKDGSPLWVSLTARCVIGQEGEILYYQGFFEDISERKRLESEYSERMREVRILSEMNSALLHAASEPDLLREYCRIVVELGGYRMAWVGIADSDPEKNVIPIAWFGHEDGYLTAIQIKWDGGDYSRGPTGRALRSGHLEVAQDYYADPGLEKYRAEANQRGYYSSIAVPFRVSDSLTACLTAYGATRNSWSEAERRLMDQVASALGFGIKTLRTALAKEQYQRDLRTSLEQMIQVVADTVEQRDPYTAGHQRRVADLCTRIACKLGLGEDRIQGLRLAATIHDLGKIGVPSEILFKPAPLTPIQFSLIKEHVEFGYEILKNVAFPWSIADIIRQHHERLDGSGYPLGLKGDAILLEGRILAVADVVEALNAHRPYRPSLGIENALNDILAGRGTLYDPEVVNACLQLFREDGYTFPP